MEKLDRIFKSVVDLSLALESLILLEDTIVSAV